MVTLEIVDVLGFISRNPSVIPHMLIMATCSALGQLFIFKTIKHYGPLVFATIQTVRQLLSVVLSILYFGHPINRMEAKKNKKTKQKLSILYFGHPINRMEAKRQDTKTRHTKANTQKVSTLTRASTQFRHTLFSPSFVTRTSRHAHQLSRPQLPMHRRHAFLFQTV